MPLIDYDDFYSQLSARKAVQRIFSGSTAAHNKFVDMWRQAIREDTGATSNIPTTAVALDKSDGAAINHLWPNSSPLSLYALGARLSSPGTQGTLFLIDRLSHQGGLNGTITTAQTTNLPTAALTRYTDGIGVFIGLSIYNAVGTTATTVTASYTNQDNASGQTTSAQAFGGSATSSGNSASPRIVILPLANGDRGVKSVESVTLSGTTGTIGNFGVVLFKILAAINYPVQCESVDFISGNFIGGIPQINDNAHLSVVGITTTSASAPQLSVFFGEG